MKKHYLQDRFNPHKYWIVSKTACRHYQINQLITTLDGIAKPLYKKNRRESLSRISELVWQDKKTIQQLFK